MVQLCNSIAMRKIMRKIFCLLCWLVFVVMWHTHAQKSYQQTKKDIIQQVYSNEAYLPLIDIQQATIDLNTLQASLDRIQDQASLREEQQETIDNRVWQLRLAIATILKDTESTKKTIQKTLQSLSILKMKIATNEQRLEVIQEDQLTHRESLQQYLRFMYITNNAFVAEDDTTATLRMLLNDDWFAQSFSQKDFVWLLTQQIVALLWVLESNEALVADLIQTLRTDVQSYSQEWITLDTHMQYLEQQRTSVFELMAYLQKESTVIDSQVWRIQASEEQLVQSKSTLERLVARPNQVVNSELYAVIEEDKGSDDNNFYSRPFVWEPIVQERWSVSNDSTRFDIEQGTTLYSPAAGIVHEVQRSESTQLWWIVLLHKDWYATFMSPVSQVFVEAWDIIKRWQVIARSGWKPWTWWAWLDSVLPHLDITVKKSWQPIDPITLFDLSVFSEEVIVGKYQKDYIQDQWVRQVYVNALDSMQWETVLERAYAFLRIYAKWAFSDPTLWYQWAEDTGINPILGMCIGFAETSFKNFKTPNNIGNVWNDDRWRTVTFDTPALWVRALFNVFNNQYLWDYYLLNQLSRFGNDEWFIYASSPYNWQKNIMNCLTSIYGYRVPEDFPFRIPSKK